MRTELCKWALGWSLDVAYRETDKAKEMLHERTHFTFSYALNGAQVRMFYLIVLFVCVAEMSYSCSPKSASVDTTTSESSQILVSVNTEYLCQHWVSSREEERQTDKEQIYRPKDFKGFAPSRFRMQYIFHKNGDCEWYYLAPDDGHYFKSGKWRIDPNDNGVLQIVKGDTTESYRVTKLTKDMLRLAVMILSKWAPFVDFARGDVCSDIRNRLFVIDDVLVFADSAGGCNDASYSEVLFGKTVDDVLCAYQDTKGGPRKSCRDPKYKELFDTIITHLDEPDLGLGPNHTVRQLSF